MRRLSGILALAVLGAAVGARAQDAGASESAPVSGSDDATEAAGSASGDETPSVERDADADLRDDDFMDPAADTVPGDGTPALELGPPLDDAELVAREAPRGRALGDPRHVGLRRIAAWGELSITAGGPDDGRVVAFVPEVGVRFRVAEEIVADVSWGLVVADTAVRGAVTLGGAEVPFDESVGRVDPGNPVLAGRWMGAPREDLDVEVGLALAVPTAARSAFGIDAPTLAERAGSEVSHRAANSMRGWWSPWRFAPERLSLVVPARVVGRLDAVTLEGEGAAGVMIPVLGDQASDVDLVLQLAVGAGVELLEPLSLGARVRVVGGATGDTLPGAIASAEPWVRLDLAPVHATMRGVINLNGMDGLVGRRGPGWGLFLGVGASD